MKEIHNKIRLSLIQALGEDAMNSPDCKTSPIAAKLTKAVAYLSTQLDITGQWVDDVEGKLHIKEVLTGVSKILEDKK